jgi:hypothetical protein
MLSIVFNRKRLNSHGSSVGLRSTTLQAMKTTWLTVLVALLALQTLNNTAWQNALIMVSVWGMQESRRTGQSGGQKRRANNVCQLL